MSALDLTARGLALRALSAPIAAERIASGVIDPARLPAPAWSAIDSKPDFGLLASASLSEPAAPRLLYWDTAAESVAWLRLGSGLSLSGDVLSGPTGDSSSSGTPAWQEIAQASPTGTAMVEFTAIPAACTELSVLFEGVSHDSATNTGMSTALSADGVTFAAATGISSAMPATGTWHGALYIPHCRGSSGLMLVSISNIASTPGQALSGSHTAWRVDGGIGALRIMPGAGNFDGGTIRLLGR